MDYLDAAIVRVGTEIATRLRVDDDTLDRLATIPGVGPDRRDCRGGAGPGGRALPDRGASGGLGRPGLGQLRECRQTLGREDPARKRLVTNRASRGRPGRGHTKDTYLAAQYRRLAARRGAKRAVVAVAHTILTIIYHLLRDQTTYRELGGQYFDERDRQATERRLVRRLEV